MFRTVSKKRIPLVLVCWLLLASCQPATSTPYPTPVLWTLQQTPSTRWLGPLFNLCVQQQPGIALTVEEMSWSDIDPASSTFSIVWGAPAGDNHAAFILGSDELVLIVNPENQIETLTSVEVKDIYRGAVRNWGHFGEGQAESGEDITAWHYPQGNDVYTVYSTVFQQSLQPQAFIHLAPDPEAMRRAVADNPDAIGYLPARWLDESVRRVSVTDIAPEITRQPLLLQSRAELDGARESWAACLQSALSN
jgi:hypothetical protein